jgi:hypothetical protein
LEQFALTANILGRWNAVFLNGTPLPNYPWLAEPIYHLTLDDSGDFTAFIDPTKSDNAWGSHAVQKHFDEALQERIKTLYAERKHFFWVLDQLPRTFCHNDLDRRNLMIRQGTGGLKEVIALDWSSAGNGPLAYDLGKLIGMSQALFDYEPGQAAELYTAVLEAYLAGLEEGGWQGNPDKARLSCLIALAFEGLLTPAWTYIFSENEDSRNLALFGRSGEEMIIGWVTLAKFCLERADEARQLMARMDLLPSS